MEVTEHLRVEVTDPSGAGHARRVAAALATRTKLDATAASRLAIVVTEIGTNLFKHGHGGEVLLRGLRVGETPGVGVLALDRGPGLANPALALRDGHSSAGSSGTGLGAIRRQASLFDLHSVPGHGTALVAEVWPEEEPPPSRFRTGGVNVPFPGEAVSGDAWGVFERGARALVVVADGVGHGVLAAEAAAAAVAVVRVHEGDASPSALVERIHEALRATRGAAVAVAEIDRERRLVRFSGLGNIAASILEGDVSRSLVSHHGTAGHQARRIQEFQYPWSARALLLLHSDGLVSHWTLDRYAGISARHPALAAGVLYRDFRRGRDDVCVVAVREAA